MTAELTRVPTIALLQQAYRQGQLSPVDVVRALYQRLRSEPFSGVFLEIEQENVVFHRALSLEAQPLETRGALFGVPFAVKDNIDVAGAPTTAACPQFAYVPTEHAACVKAALAAGAIYIGKTNLDQFATGLVGLRTPYPVPKNVFHPDYVPGGSSSGSALAVAHGLVSFAFGTDTAGSGRVPAAMNALVGFKPTPGAVSTRGVVPACRAQDCVSVFAHSVDDCARVLEVIKGFDPLDAYSVEKAAAAPFEALSVETVRKSRALRVAVPEAEQLLFFDDLSRQNFNRVLDACRANGCDVVRFDYRPFQELARLLYEGPWVAQRLEAAGALLASNPGALLDVIREIVSGATRYTALDVYRADARFRVLKRKTLGVWRNDSLMLLPTVPGPARVLDVLADPIGINSLLGTYTNFVNLLGLCAVAVPSGFESDGLPRGVTVVGPGKTDARVAGMAQGIQSWLSTLGDASIVAPTLEGRASPPAEAVKRRRAVVEIAGGAAPPNLSRRQDLVVFGAHMRGQPLNHELSELGAEFVGEVLTAPRYRMYALRTQPPKPGLIQVNDAEQGSQIEGERWSLSAESLGSFTGRLKAPLCLGRVQLENGSQCLGFLCEAAAIHGAPDVSEFRNWKAFLAAQRT